MCKKEELIKLEISICDLEYLDYSLYFLIRTLKRDEPYFCHLKNLEVLKKMLGKFIDKYYEED